MTIRQISVRRAATTSTQFTAAAIPVSVWAWAGRT